MTAEPLEIYLEEQDLGRGLRDDVRAGLTAEPEVAAAEVVLRRPRQRAVRGDHPAAGVLPDPGRAGRPRRAGRRDRRADRREDPGRAGLRLVGEDPAAARRASPRAAGWAPSCRWTCRSARCAQSTDADRRRLPGAARARHRRRLHPPPGPAARPAAGGWWRSSAAPSATCCRPSGRRSWPRLRAALEPGDWLLLGTDLVKDPAVLVPAYDDAAGVTAEFNRNVLRVINRELGADFDPDGVRPRRALGRRSRSGSRCGCGRDRPMRVASGARPGRGLRRGRGAAHRDLGEVPPGGGRGRAGRGRVRARATAGPTRTACSASPWPGPTERTAVAAGEPRSPAAAGGRPVIG